MPQQMISNEIAQLYKSHLGRGPTKVTTSINGRVVVCVLESTDTPYEQTVLAAGGQDLVHEARRRIQLQCGPELIGIVERVTGLSVRAHVSGYDVPTDIATEVFLLEGEEDPA